MWTGVCMYSEVEHAVTACELETDDQNPLRRQQSCIVSVCHTDLTHYGDGRSSHSMSEEDLSPVGSSDHRRQHWQQSCGQTRGLLRRQHWKQLSGQPRLQVQAGSSVAEWERTIRPRPEIKRRKTRRIKHKRVQTTRTLAEIRLCTSTPA